MSPSSIITIMAAVAVGALILVATSTHARAAGGGLMPRGIAGDRRSPRQETGTCTPESDEYDERALNLFCDEEYFRAWRAELESSECVNYFLPDFNTELPCPYEASNDSPENCTLDCSVRQYVHFFCKYLGEKRARLDRECGYTFDQFYCGYDGVAKQMCIITDLDEAFQNNRGFHDQIEEDCYGNPISVVDGRCSSGCRESLITLRMAAGCCLDNALDEFYEYAGKDFGVRVDIFAVCKLHVPEPCVPGLPDDNEAVRCARGNLTITNGGLSTGVCDTIMIFAGIIFAGYTML